MKRVLLIYIFSISTCFADRDCELFRFCGNAGKSSSKSLPSSSTSAGLNPANISEVRGTGLEAIYQQGNPLAFDIASGNGKVGALLSPTVENGFFGNRSIEVDEVTYYRKLYKKQYVNKKIGLAVGMKLVDKPKFGLDLGLAVKRNPALRRLNFGQGISGRLGPFHFGAYIAADDIQIDLANYYNPYTSSTYQSIYKTQFYQERFSVSTYTFGVQIKDLSLDAGLIRSEYKFYPEPTEIYLYSASYLYKKFLFNLAKRSEYSSNYNFENNQMVQRRKKVEYYYGAQYLMSKHVMIGAQYNNYLLHEVSFMLTLFI